jgi:hypothetical protein
MSVETRFRHAVHDLLDTMFTEDMEYFDSLWRSRARPVPAGATSSKPWLTTRLRLTCGGVVHPVRVRHDHVKILATASGDLLRQAFPDGRCSGPDRLA